MEADKIFDVARRRGFFFASSEIYGGFSGFYDYGNIGTLLKHKIEKGWRKFFLGLSDSFFEIETSNIMPEKVFQAGIRRVLTKPVGASAMLIDATRKWDYPPVSLPRREYMERAREIWEAEGLPRLKPVAPWHGYELGYWPEKYREAANLNLQGEVFKLGEMRIKERVPFKL